jgi:hypothetical protein
MFHARRRQVRTKPTGLGLEISLSAPGQAEVKQRLVCLCHDYVDDWLNFSARARLTPLAVTA